ncbi:MAG: PqqD family protein [Dehalococcoidia bacterium]|nr:MAG: PqqD family protein [Dehalococcoidia bacterium]
MLSKYAIRSRSSAYRIINGLALIVGGQDSQIRTLNKVGTFIWTLADGKHTLSEIINQVCRDFEVDNSRATQDIEVFVKEMESRHLLLLTDNPTTLEENK